MFKSPKKTKEPENLEKAYDYAVFLLSLQLRTIGEVIEKMKNRGYPQNIIDEVIARLKVEKALDDERYAEVFLDNLKQYKNLGYFGIKKKFMMKKLSNDLIERVLADGLSLADELKIAKRFLKKEGVIVKPSANDSNAEDNTYSTYNEAQSTQKQKLAQKLRARGFRMDVIAKLVF